MIAAFLVVPTLETLRISLYDWNLVSPHNTFVGWANYASILRDREFWQVIGQSVLYVVAALIGTFLIPLVLALATFGCARDEAELWQSLIFTSTVVPISIGSLLWLWILLPQGGPLNTVLAALHLGTPVWLNDPRLALWSVSAVAAWKYLGFNYLFLIAALVAIPSEILEAARLDGARGLTSLRRIVLPMIAPALAFVAVTTFLQALEITFVPIQVLTVGGPANSSNQLVYSVYQDGFQYFVAGKASAKAVLMLLLLGAAAVAQVRLLERGAAREAP